MHSERPSTYLFPARLKASRRLRKWKQRELASLAGITTSSIGHLEVGSRKPTFDTLLRLADALEVTTDYLLGRVEVPWRAEVADPLARAFGELKGEQRTLCEECLLALLNRSNQRT
jgi:transcriptional regulator with XRE-family HTH domain